MTCVVTGFPSRYAALQFEWAWQNTHATRHIQREVRDARLEELQRNKKGSPSKRKSKPPMSLEARLKNLHHLLGVQSFNRWPLHVRFFASDVFGMWEKYTAKMAPRLRDTVVVRLTPAELPASSTTTPTDPTTGDQVFRVPQIIQAIPVAYEDCKSYVEQAKSIFKEANSHSCGICRSKLDAARTLTVVCPLESCRATSHMSCLATRFLAEESNRDSLIPIKGTCLRCRTPLNWSTLMKELSLRTRGQKEVEAMFKPKRRRKAQSTSEPEAPDPRELGEEDEDLDETWMEHVYDGEEELPTKTRSVVGSV